MDHTGGYYMAMAIMMALLHRDRTGEGQWVDMSCTEAGAGLHGADLLDHTVNERALRAPDRPDSNHATSPSMAPHNVYRCQGDDNWVAIVCRDDDDWRRLKSLVGAEAAELGLSTAAFDTVEGRLAGQADLDDGLGRWCATRSRWDIQVDLQALGVPAAAVARPGERIDGDIATGSRDMWPMIEHRAMGGVRVDGQPVRFSVTDWSIDHGAPTLGQHNDYVFGQLLGYSNDELDHLRRVGAI
jgi:crotonobetainyl-CoA:carnitine CoA-transferase CaiB-like acyl-CoA transferase